MENAKLSSKRKQFNPDLLLFQNLEANRVFPSDPKSSYTSSYYSESYDFPFNPDDLAQSNDYSTYDEMRHDDQVKAVLSLKKDIVLAPGWEIRCENEDITKFIENNFIFKLENQTLDDALRDILTGFDYGFSLTEVLYRKNKEAKVEVKSFRTRPPHSFEFHLNNKGDVQKIVQNQDVGPKEFKPNYFLHYTYQPEFGNPYGISDLKAAFQSWKTKKFFLRFWGIYVERFAAPTVIGMYPPDFDENKITRFQEMLKTTQNATVITIPEGAKIDFKMANRDTSNVYESGISLLNTMIARAILMPDLLGMSGSKTSGGSFALGQTQFQMFMATIQKEQNALAKKITNRIIRPLVLANWGDIPCEFAFKPYTKDDSSEFMKLWIEATKNKLWVPSKEEVDHIREMLKFPVVDVEIAPPQPAAPRPFAEKEEPQAMEFREKTRFEKQINFAEIKRHLDTNEQRVTPKLKSAAKIITQDYLDQIKDKNIITKFKPEKINELKPRFQKEMNIEMKNYMKDLYIDSFNQAQKEFFPRTEQKFAVTEELLPEEFLTMIDAEAFKIVGDYSINISNKMRNMLTQGIKNGMSEIAILKEIRDMVPKETDKWLKTVIRTKSTEMFNRARHSYYENDELAQQVVEAYQFSAIIDDRTSDVCRFLDGKIFNKGDFTNHIVPPLHFNCRSVLVPVTKFEDFKTEKKYVPPSKEPSIDSLKEKGGNLLLIDKSITKKFGEGFMRSGEVVDPGFNPIIASPGPRMKIIISMYELNNLSTRDEVIAGIHLDDEDEIHFEKVLKPRDNIVRNFPDPGWILPANKGVNLHMNLQGRVKYTFRYQIAVVPNDNE